MNPLPLTHGAAIVVVIAVFPKAGLEMKIMVPVIKVL